MNTSTINTAAAAIAAYAAVANDSATMDAAKTAMTACKPIAEMPDSAEKAGAVYQIAYILDNDAKMDKRRISDCLLKFGLRRRTERKAISVPEWVTLCAQAARKAILETRPATDEKAHGRNDLYRMNLNVKRRGAVLRAVRTGSTNLSRRVWVRTQIPTGR
jgi:hypothetical protein